MFHLYLCFICICICINYVSNLISSWLRCGGDCAWAAWAAHLRHPGACLKQKQCHHLFNQWHYLFHQCHNLFHHPIYTSWLASRKIGPTSVWSTHTSSLASVRRIYVTCVWYIIAKEKGQCPSQTFWRMSQFFVTMHLSANAANSIIRITSQFIRALWRINQ